MEAKGIPTKLVNEQVDRFHYLVVTWQQEKGLHGDLLEGTPGVGITVWEAPVN